MSGATPSPEPAPTGRRFPVALVRLGWISLWTDIASEMSTPLIPLYLGSMLAAPGFALGLIEGAAQATNACLTALAGWRSDRLRRRVPFIRWGYGLAIGSKVLLALASTWPAVLALRLCDRVGKGLRTAPRDALIVDLAGARRGAAFGLHRAMDTAGALIGALLAALLLALLPARYQLVFALSALPGLAAIGLTLRLREPAREAVIATPPRESLGQALRQLPRTFWIASALLWWLSLAALPVSFLILRAKETNLGDAGTLLLYAGFNVVYAVSAYPAGRLSDRIGRRALLVSGWALHVLTLGLAVFAEGLGVAVLFALFGLQEGITHGVGKAWVADHAPAHLRATALGVMQFGSGLALLAGGIVAGLLWDHIDPRATFGFAAAVSALGVLGLVFFARPSPAPTHPGE